MSIDSSVLNKPTNYEYREQFQESPFAANKTTKENKHLHFNLGGEDES